MFTKDILNKLDLGLGVAEKDQMLDQHFLKTNVYHLLIKGEKDIILGTKGAGKSAIFRYVSQNYKNIEYFNNKEVISAVNLNNHPVFSVIKEKDNINETQFVALWKWYFFALIANSIIKTSLYERNERLREIEILLIRLNIPVDNDKPKKLFEYMANWFHRLANPSSIETGVSFDVATGNPEISFKIGYQDDGIVQTKDGTISPDNALEKLDQFLRIVNHNIWLMVDRLDDAFNGISSIEYAAIRSLFRVYLEMGHLERIKLKIFIRVDLYESYIASGFPSMVTINTMKCQIYWDDDDLIDLLYNRLFFAEGFAEIFSDDNISGVKLFEKLCPKEIKIRGKAMQIWKWVFLHIRDGNNNKTPRNLIDLIIRAKEAQIHNDEREKREYNKENVLIEAESFRKAFVNLSHDRISDTLREEAREISDIIEQFRNSKAEQNYSSLKRIIGDAYNEIQSRAIIKKLTDIGFLEQVGANYKVPLIYREGLNITQGKAF